MSVQKPDVLVLGPAMPMVLEALGEAFTLHKFWQAQDPDALIAQLAPRLRAMVATATPMQLDGHFMEKFPHLEIVAAFGVGYDHVDAAWAGEHGIVVTNTPQVLDEEVADTALGLLLCTVRELSRAERYLRAGKWLEKPFPFSKATLRNRTVGMVGMGRIGKAIARRLDAFAVPVVYHARHEQPDLAYRYYPDLIAMARDVDVLMAIVPGGPATKHLIDGAVLQALGPDGILINMARGSVVDEDALVKALADKTILSAGLDVFVHEPKVPAELLAMDHITLFPHMGSSSQYTRNAMAQLLIDNVLAWAAGRPPLTPVAETPWPSRKRA